ncbi:MAG TPA: hypothetical protein VGM73_12505, partial [Candidatus Didemnitutus sp.]
MIHASSIQKWLSAIFAAALLGFAVWRNVIARLHRPSFKKEEIIYQEFFASGSSQKTLLTSI